MGLKKLAVELTSLCNLDCHYCFKKAGATHLDIDVLQKVLVEANSWGATKVTYTGGEPSLYPLLEEALHITANLGYRYAIVTNGWHFARILPFLKDTRRALQHIFFSLDSATEALHDQVRGPGSYQRIMNAAGLCRQHSIPFSFLAVLTQKNFDEIEQLAMLAMEAGASGMKFGHMLPTPQTTQQTPLQAEEKLVLDDVRRRAAERRAQYLDSILKIAVSFSASATNDSPGACCEPLAGQTISVDCHGRLSLCCQLAEYRGSTNNNDIVADLNTTNFANAYARFIALAVAQRNRRDKALSQGQPLAMHPCDFCVRTMDKSPKVKVTA